MENGFFDFFYTKTEGYLFSMRQGDIPGGINGDPHAREVKALISQVRRMAVKKSLQLPETFVADCDREEWIQTAMITMFHCCETYDGKRPFDNFVRFMVSRKLLDKHRSLLRKNPPADKEILYLYGEMKKSMGDKTAIARLAKHTNRTVEQLQNIVDAGVGPRVFTQETEDTLRTAASSASMAPETQTEARELRGILWACVDRLAQKSKAIFIRHEMEEVSLKNLFGEAGCRRSFATFKRWYKRDIFEQVQKCVVSRS
ncbi:MAG: hypothetical protein U9R43_08165 [Thermodesulfobacteriota bacterium]|nr:hypothetical protein [Thermodesulfobacteriota bacterium]